MYRILKIGVFVLVFVTVIEVGFYLYITQAARQKPSNSYSKRPVPGKNTAVEDNTIEYRGIIHDIKYDEKYSLIILYIVDDKGEKVVNLMESPEDFEKESIFLISDGQKTAINYKDFRVGDKITYRNESDSVSKKPIHVEFQVFR